MSLNTLGNSVVKFYQGDILSSKMTDGNRATIIHGVPKDEAKKKEGVTGKPIYVPP